MRDARRKLRDLAKKHPELTGPRGLKNRTGWEALMREDTMANTRQYTFRLPDDLVALIDEFGERLTRETGIDLARADVVKHLLKRALASADAIEPKKRKR